MEVLSGWGLDTDSRLYFRKNYAKYEFFRKPLVSLTSRLYWDWKETWNAVILTLLSFGQEFFPDHMVSISSESDGTVDPSQLIQVGYWSRFIYESNVYILKPSTKIYFLFILPNADVSQVQQLSRGTWIPLCQRTRQEILEEVILCSAEIRALLFQQRNFQGEFTLQNKSHFI